MNEIVMSSERERNVRWTDPAAAALKARGLTGRELLERIRDGEHPLPPMVALVGLQIRDVEEGRVVMTLVPQEWLSNPMGTLHGGAYATLLDTVMACALTTLLPAQRGCTTLELKLNFLRPVRLESVPSTGEGRVINMGRQTVLTEGILRDGAGKLCAHATATFSLFDAP